MKSLALPVTAIIAGIFLALAATSGCGQSNVAQSSNPIFSGSCSGTGCSSTNTFTGGATGNLNITSVYALSEYAGVNLNNPTDVVVNINLAQVTSSPPIYLGQMTIQFNDGSVAHSGTFVNGTSVFTWNGNSNNVSTLVGNTYRIFFEDPAGAIVLTMANPTGTDTVSSTTGQIWFSNFNAAGAPNPLYQGGYDQNGNYYPQNPLAFCWVITEGPYDCRNFGVPPSSASGSVPAFSLLGTIPSINLNEALGI